MPTNDRKLNIYPKRLLGRTAIKDEFLDYLQGAVDEVATGFFQNASGTLDEDKVGLNNSSGGSTFDIDTTDAQRVLAAQHTIDLTKITGVDITTGILFENALGDTYYIGVFYAEVEVGIEVNPRTGNPEYPSLKQSFGKVAIPTGVTDHATYIRLDLTSITEAAISHAGRTVKVWLATPVSPDETVAFYSGTVVFGGGINYVDIPYSGANGPLGQDTSSAPPSTTAADYKVFIEGVSWSKTVDLRTIATCAYLGKATGGAPPTFDTGDQRILQLISLDRGYDGLPGAGAGRKIYVDHGAVELETATTADDEQNAQLRLTRIGNTDYYQVGLQMIAGDLSAIPLFIAQLQRNAALLHESEPVDVVGDTITFTRPPSLTNTALRIDKNTHAVWIRTGTAAGIYTIDTLAAAAITVKDPQTGASPAWGAEAGLQCSILYPRILLANTLPAHGGCAALANWAGLLLTGRDGEGNSTPMLKLLPDGGIGNLLSVKNSRVNATHLADPRDAILTDFDAADHNVGLRIQMGQYIGTVGAENNVHAVCGLDLRPQVFGSGNADKYALNIKPQTPGTTSRPPSTRQVGFHNDAVSNVEIMRWEPRGRMADVHRFIERFAYKQGAAIPAEIWTQSAMVNGGTVIFNVDGTMYGHGDIVNITTAGVADGDGVALTGPACWIMRATGGTNRKLNFYARARTLLTGLNVWYGLGIYNTLITATLIGFRVYNTVVANDWEMFSRVAAVDNTGGFVGPLDVTGALTNNLGWQDFYFTVDIATNTITYWMTGMGSPSLMSIKAAGLGAGDWLDARVAPFIVVGQHGDTAARTMEIDHIEVWDETIVAGPVE